MTNKNQIVDDKSLDNVEHSTKILQLLNHPWRLLKEGGKLGLNGGKRFFTIVSLFCTSNIILFIYAISRVLSTEFKFSNILVVTLVATIGISITIYSAYRTYKYVKFQLLQLIYESSSTIFQKISEFIVEEFQNISIQTTNISNSKLSSFLKLGIFVNSKFEKSPKILRNGIILILNRIPFASMVTDLNLISTTASKEEATVKLFQRMDTFIRESIFNSNNTRWVYWFFPLNIFIVIFIIKILIG